MAIPYNSAVRRAAFFVGEVMPVKHLNYWRQYLPHVQFVNLYGQSEIAGIACYQEVKKTYDDGEQLPIGKPLPNCHVYLFDGDELITDSGRVGEICIESDALALEYFHDEEKTSQSFCSILINSVEKRVFKTGDFAYYNEEQELIFAARKDSQIKHHGRRIELGEIETAAQGIPYINRCCCLYDADNQMINLICEVTQADVTPVMVQVALAEKLQKYMIPERVKILDRLPINANGKVDRQALKELIKQ